MKKEKKQFIISIIAIVVLVLFVLGATYAYFQAQTGEGKSVDINITSSTVDSLTFSTGDAISLSATQSNFGTGEASLSGSTTASATLVANNSTNYAEATYYLYIKISSNDFAYTTSDSTPELILSITGPDGEVTSLSGLTYTTVEDNQGVSYSGFDVTTTTGKIAIVELYEIVSTGTETDEWTITVTFINLSTDQSANAGSSFSAEVIIQSDEYKQTIAEYVISTYSTDGDNNLYYMDGSGDYASCEAGDNSYRFSGGDYVLTDTATNAGYSTITNTSSSGTTGFIQFYCNGSKRYVGATCSSSYSFYYTLAYDTEATQYSTYQEALDQAVSDGYLTSDNVKNYVCFGSDSDPCPDNNLYRIIGFFVNDAGEYEMKIIKADIAQSDLLGTDGDKYGTRSYTYSENRNSVSEPYTYYWNYVNYSTSYSDTGYYNDWSYSQLNTVNLNTNYWGTIPSEWQAKVSEHTWNVGGMTYSSSSTVKTYYTKEITNPSTQVTSTYTANVGLMYVSDYGYAADMSYCTTALYSYSSAKESNWMYNGVYEWTISRSSTGTTYAFIVYLTGYVNSNGVNNFYAVRPVLYLVSSTTISGGSGTQSDPYRIT